MPVSERRIEALRAAVSLTTAGPDTVRDAWAAIDDLAQDADRWECVRCAEDEAGSRADA